MEVNIDDPQTQVMMGRNSLLDRSQNYALHFIGSFPGLCIYLAFGRISFHLHYICISFAFRIAPRISIFALHFISISKCQINVKC